MDKKYIYELCRQHNISISELEKTLNMSNGSLRKDGDIKSERLLAIADYFHVSTDYLLKGIEIEGISIDADSIMLLHHFGKLTERQKLLVNKLVKEMSKQKDEEEDE